MVLCTMSPITLLQDDSKGSHSYYTVLQYYEMQLFSSYCFMIL